MVSCVCPASSRWPADRLASGGAPLQGQQLRFGRGPPLQGVRVRRVVPRPAPTRGRGTSLYHSNANPLHRRPSRAWRLPLLWATAKASAPPPQPPQRRCPCPTKPRPQRGERRGSTGIGRKQAMDGLRSPVGAKDGGTRRCALSPYYRGSPRSHTTTTLLLCSALLCSSQRGAVGRA